VGLLGHCLRREGESLAGTSIQALAATLEILFDFDWDVPLVDRRGAKHLDKGSGRSGVVMSGSQKVRLPERGLAILEDRIV
jgi:hypothetical protein